VIGPTRRVRVFAFTGPVDMRKSYDTLGAVVANELGRDILEGDVFLFVGRTRKRAKVLYWDGTGLCVLQKRLEKGRFAAPWERAKSSPSLEWTPSELALFLEGSEHVGRLALSPPAWDPSERRVVFR
jgi:transposase